MPRTKAIPSKTATAAEREANRVPRAIGWQENSEWWLGKGRDANASWEDTPSLTMTDSDGNVLSDWTGLTPLPLTRGCVKAFSCTDVAALKLSQPLGKASLLADKAYQNFIKELTSVPEVPIVTGGQADIESSGVFALPRPDLLLILYGYAMRGPGVLRKWEDAAAVAAGNVLRNAVVKKDCTWVTLQLAFNVLLLLPPSVSTTQHEAVAAILVEPYELPEVLTYAAHTLACMGPQAVTEHYEEIMTIASAGGECVAAAWLCVCVLEPYALDELEVRGAPVRSLCAPGSPFAKDDMVDGLLVGEGQGSSHRHGFPQTQDVMTALRHKTRCMATQRRAFLFERLTRFVPVSLDWSIATHQAFPIAARHRAIEVLMIGAALARGKGADQHTGVTLASLPIDLWAAFVIGHVVQRRSKPGGDGDGIKLEF